MKSSTEETAKRYLKEIYELDPEDVQIEDWTIEEVERVAKKFDLRRRMDMTLQQAQNYMKRFKIYKK